MVDKHLGPSIGRKQLSRLTPSDIEVMLNAKVAPKEKSAALSARTAHHIRAALRNALRMAERDGLVSRNVAALAAPPRVAKTEMKTLPPDQVGTFLEAVRGDRLEALYVTTLGLALHQSEVLGLRWSEVDVAAGTLRVSRALQWIRPEGGGAGVPHLVEPKSETSRRTVRLPGFVGDALREHRARWLAERLELGPRWLNEWDLVFVGPIGEPLNPRTVLLEFHAALKRAGLPRIRFHDLRHSCASLLGARGVPAKVCRPSWARAPISLTLGTYSHVFAEQHEQGAVAMDGILGATGAG